MIPTSQSTIDAAGRLVIPKAIRQAAGLRPGLPLEIRYENGRVAIEPAPTAVRIAMHRGVAVAIPTQPVATVTGDEVEALRRQLREERENRAS